MVASVLRMLGRLARRCAAPGTAPCAHTRDQGDGSAHLHRPEPRVPPALLAAKSEGGVEP